MSGESENKSWLSAIFQTVVIGGLSVVGGCILAHFALGALGLDPLLHSLSHTFGNATGLSQLGNTAATFIAGDPSQASVNTLVSATNSCVSGDFCLSHVFNTTPAAPPVMASQTAPLPAFAN